jgi:hypothetical protein
MPWSSSTSPSTTQQRHDNTNNLNKQITKAAFFYELQRQAEDTLKKEVPDGPKSTK